MRLPFDLSAITEKLSAVISSFLSFSFRMPGASSFHVPLWAIAALIVVVFLIASQLFRRR